MNTEVYQKIQKEIITALHVNPNALIYAEATERKSFLMSYLQKAKCNTYVLGVSGGVDSTVAAKLAQEAVETLRKLSYNAKFIAVRLPYGEQRDEEDAQRALEFIKPDEVLTVNIKEASDRMLETLGVQFKDEAHRDFVLGNIKARQRMIAQYAIAGANNGLVIGTDHAAEAVMGFYTKFGDGACDVAPLSGLTKRQVRSLASYLGAPDHLALKVPTADLESLNPGLPDEAAFGITYDEISDFLEGKIVSGAVADKIITTYNVTAHKRSLPVAPWDM